MTNIYFTLHKAADKGDLPPLKVAIEGYRNEYEDVWVKPDLNAQTKKGDVALHLAVCNVQSDIEAVRVLLESSATRPWAHGIARRTSSRLTKAVSRRPGAQMPFSLRTNTMKWITA